MKTVTAALALALLFGPAAKAATIYVGITGIAAGVDVDGLFGAAGADVTGDTYSALFTVDTASPGAILYDPASTPGISGIVGGSDFGLLSPVSSVFTMNGFSVSFPAASLSDGEDILQGPLNDGLLDVATRNVSTVGNATIITELKQAIDHLALPTLDYTAGFSGSCNTTSATSSPCSSGVITFDYSVNPNGNNGENIELAPTSVTVSDVAPVPEPPSWLLMLAGAGTLVAMRSWRFPRRPSISSS